MAFLRLIAVLLPAAIAVPAVAADKTTETDVTVRLVSGRTAAGRLLAFSEKGMTLRDQRGAEVDIPTESILRVDRKLTGNSKSAATSFVYLANGDRLAATATKIDGDDLHVTWSGLTGKPSMKLQILSVRGIIFQRPKKRAEFQRLESTLLATSRKSDVLILRNGDRITGRLKELTTTSATISGAAGTIARKNIVAVTFDPAYLKNPRSSALRYIVLLADGTRVSAESVALRNGGNLGLRLQSAAAIELQWSQVLSLQIIGGSVVPLSSLAPTRFEQTPFLDGKKPLKANRNVLGGPLTLRGREYSIGLGMHSRSTATYAVPSAARRFLATVGIDDAAKREGSVIFSVQQDGKTVFTSPVLTGKSPPLQIGPINVEGAKKLTLFVDYGPRGDILDYANWCDAVFIKK